MIEYITGTVNRHTRWWLKIRDIEVIQTPFGKSACAEFYCPWYFKPLDLLYDIFYGKRAILERVRETKRTINLK